MADEASRREIAAEPWEYVLYELPDGGYEIDVFANQSAFYYFKTHRLTDDEAAKVKARGAAYLQTLARTVRYGA